MGAWEARRGLLGTPQPVLACLVVFVCLLLTMPSSATKAPKGRSGVLASGALTRMVTGRDPPGAGEPGKKSKAKGRAGRSASPGTRSGSPGARTASLTRSGSVKGHVSALHKKRKMKPHNLGPAGWMDKIKRPDLQRRAISMKGAANGRKKPSYHFWTKSKIKDFIKKRVKHQAEVRKQRAALPLRNLGRGARRMKWTWLPSVLEQKLIDAEKERLAEEKAREDAEKAAADKATKEEAGGEDGEGSGGGGGDESGGGGGDDDAGDGGGSGGGGGGGDDDDEDGSNPFGGMSF